MLKNRRECKYDTCSLSEKRILLVSSAISCCVTEEMSEALLESRRKMYLQALEQDESRIVVQLQQSTAASLASHSPTSQHTPVLSDSLMRVDGLDNKMSMLHSWLAAVHAPCSRRTPHVPAFCRGSIAGNAGCRKWCIEMHVGRDCRGWRVAIPMDFDPVAQSDRAITSMKRP